MTHRFLLTLCLVSLFGCSASSDPSQDATKDAPQDEATDTSQEDASVGTDTSTDAKDTPEDVVSDDATLDPIDTMADASDMSTQPGPTQWLTGAAGWTHIAFPETSGTVRASFFMRATQDNINGVVGLSMGRAGAYTQLPVIVRMNEQGTLDVRDADAYRADAQVPYVAGEAYFVEIEVTPSSGRSSVWITSPGGPRVKLIADAAFRTEQAQTQTFDHLNIYEPDARLDVADLVVQSQSIPLVPVAPPTPSGLWEVTFDASPLGNYTDAQIRQDWDGLKWVTTGGRVSVLEEQSNRFIRVAYPKNTYGGGGGARWKVDFEDAGYKSYEDFYVSYRMRFKPGFDAAKTGKIHGLAGGQGNTGGDRPTGNDGWSSRMVWGEDAIARQYVYHSGQQGTYGDVFVWERAGATLPLATGDWVTVEHRVKMNTPGQSNGRVQGWYNGELVLTEVGLRFRNTANFGIDAFLFSTFFGGSGAQFATSRDEYIDFDDFIFSDKPITHL